MPTISQLPPVTQVTPADEVPLSQNGATYSVSVGTLLASTQPAIISGSGTLLGRSSLGAGSPETITVGVGLVLNAGTLAASANEITILPQQTALTPTDQAVLSSGGNPMLLPLSSLRGLFSAGTNISISPTGTISSNVTGGSDFGPIWFLQHHESGSSHNDRDERPGSHQPERCGSYDQLCELPRRPDD